MIVLKAKHAVCRITPNLSYSYPFITGNIVPKSINHVTVKLLFWYPLLQKCYQTNFIFIDQVDKSVINVGKGFTEFMMSITLRKMFKQSGHYSHCLKSFFVTTYIRIEWVLHTSNEVALGMSPSLKGKLTIQNQNRANFGEIDGAPAPPQNIKVYFM